MISIVTPYHQTPLTEAFLQRIELSLASQTYRDFEWIRTDEGKMAENTNFAIKKAKGDIIKILFMDDYLLHENALQNIVDNFTGGWLVSGCVHDRYGQIYNPHRPSWNSQILMGMNTLGSPSVMAMENKDPELFDENLSWMLDCDLYHRLYERYGNPTYIDSYDVAIGIGEHQTTNILSIEEKLAENHYLQNKYA